MRLTDTAQRLVLRTEAVVAELEAAQAELAAGSDVLQGTVRLSAFPNRDGHASAEGNGCVRPSPPAGFGGA